MQLLNIHRSILCGSIFILVLLIHVEAKCSPNCDGHGKCVKGRCLCDQGFFPSQLHDEIQDCKEAVTVKYGTFVALLRALFTVLWFILLVISCIGLYMNSKRRKSSEQATVINVMKISLSLLVLLSLTQVVFWSLDFYGVYGVLPLIVAYLLEGAIYPLILSVYVSLLLHWMEVYHTAVTSIKREEMLQKINSNYSSQITVEDILNKVKFLKKLRAPFIIFISGAVVMQVAREVIRVYVTLPFLFDYLWAAYFITLCLTFAIGFLTYGRRLVALMPDVVSKRMKRLTRDLTVFSVAQTIVWIAALIIAATTRGNQIVYLAVRTLVVNLFIVIISFLLIRIFTNFGSKFPYCFEFSSRSSQSSKQATSEVDVSTGGV